MKIQQLYVTIVLRSVLCRFSHQFSSPYVPEFVSPFFDIKILSVYWLENFFPENTLDKISKFTTWPFNGSALRKVTSSLNFNSNLFIV